MGITVQTDASTDFEEDAATFFKAAADCTPDCLVEAEGPTSGPYDYAAKVGLED